MVMSSPPLILHDYFAIRGGGERLVLTLAAALDATLAFGYRTGDSYDLEQFPDRLIDLTLPSPLRRSGVRPLALAGRFALARHQARAFPLRIYSGVASPFAAPADDGLNVFYCHTPPRFLFDQQAHFRAQLNPLARAVSRPVLAAFAAGYRRAVARMQLIVVNSRTTQARVQRFLGRDSVIVHPPCDTERFRWQGQGDYYLSTARLTPLKRVDRIVSAFRAMPDKKLIVASGGEDLGRLRQMAAGHPNIEIRGWVSDAELTALVGNAIATLYVPVDEDFGMSPVESMAAGKPVIGVAEGGVVETVVPGATGTLLAPHFSDDDLAGAVRAMTPAAAAAMRQRCEERAQDFDRATFVTAMRRVIDEAARAHGTTAAR